MTKELEALERLKTAPSFMGGTVEYRACTKSETLLMQDYETIKQALIQAEQYKKKAMAWDVFIKKRVWISKLRKLLLKHRDKSSQQQLEIYNSYVSCHIKLEDLELFKEFI